ncbi:MAG: hypothetical protein ACT4O0_01715 [Pseudonocardia sp.]
MGEYEWAPRERGWAGLFAVAVLGALLYPLRQYRKPRAQRVDGFPLSYYPMFSSRRNDKKLIKYVIAVRDDGSRGYLHYRHLGAGGLNQVRRQLGRAQDEDRVPAWTSALAEKLAAKDELRDVRRIEVIEGLFDLDNCLLGHQVLVDEETVLGSADLPRPPGAVPVAEILPGTRPEADPAGPKSVPA